MTWEIVLGFISIISASLAVGKVIYGLSRTLTKLDMTVANLNETLTNLATENKTDHEDLFGELSELQNGINDHEHRLTIIEERESV